MVTFVGKWWTEQGNPSVEEVAKHISALAQAAHACDSVWLIRTWATMPEDRLQAGSNSAEPS